MMEKAAKQFDELCQIKDRVERAQTACDLFSQGKLSAKALRMLFNLDSFYQRYIIKHIYAPEVRKENMKRLPPSVLAPETVLCRDVVDFDTWSWMKAYYLLEKYDSSKCRTPREKILELVANGHNNEEPFMLVQRGGVSGGIIDLSEQAIEWAIEALRYERYGKYDTSPLDLPSIMTFGLELEGVGLTKEAMIEIRKQLKGLESFRVKTDMSVRDDKGSGCEVVSGVLMDNSFHWNDLAKACDILRLVGFRANHTCGGHIHIGANILGADTIAWKTFFNVWKEVEPLMYMISNRKGERTRDGAVGYAGLITPFAERMDWRNVSLKKEDDIAKIRNMLCEKMVETWNPTINGYDFSVYDRYHSVNLTNLGTPEKNTIEFRLPNGTIDYNIVRENILLFGRLLQACKMHSMAPAYKNEEYQDLFQQDLPEKEKLMRLLDFVFDKEEEKQIFIERWRSRAGEEPLFGEASIKTYKLQKEPEKMVEQIGDVAKTVSAEKRLEAMQTLIGEEQRKNREGDTPNI